MKKSSCETCVHVRIIEGKTLPTKYCKLQGTLAWKGRERTVCYKYEEKNTLIYQKTAGEIIKKIEECVEILERKRVVDGSSVLIDEPLTWLNGLLEWITE